MPHITIKRKEFASTIEQLIQDHLSSTTDVLDVELKKNKIIIQVSKNKTIDPVERTWASIRLDNRTAQYVAQSRDLEYES